MRSSQARFSTRRSKTKKTRRGVPSRRQMPFCQAALPTLSGLDRLRPAHRAHLVARVATCFSGVHAGIPPRRNSAFLGREKGACDGLRRHPLIHPIFGSANAQANLAPILSTSFAGRNLHLVISAMRQDPAAGSPLFSCEQRAEFYRQGPTPSRHFRSRPLPDPTILRIGELWPTSCDRGVCARTCLPLWAQGAAGERQKKDPACAVYCGVLNLLSQVGPYPGTQPWLAPIALFLRDGSPSSGCWLKT
jgi:hypothetical protein